MKVTAERILKNRHRYETVAKAVDEYIPWWLIGCLHNMESGLSFAGHASNGDPLTAYTVNEPRHEPRDMGPPPFTWEETAISIYKLKRQGLAALEIKQPINNIEEALHFAQAFNGFGYEAGAGKATTPPAISPYLWSYTDQYISGKYVADGRFDPKAISQQVGVAALMKALESLGVILFESPSPIFAPIELSYFPAQTPFKIERMLSYGDIGDDVLEVSRAFGGLGLIPKNKTSRTFGDTLKAAVLAFQASQRLEVDGILGPVTVITLQGALERARGITSTVSSGISKQLHEFYSVRKNYDAVFANVKTWYPGGRSNGCVAFCSTALRLIGVKVPHTAGTKGDNISLVTLPFADWLKAQGGRVIFDHHQLLPGDICFTTDAQDWPGYPAHVYVFSGWLSAEHQNGLVIDNQDFTHPRNIFGYGAYNFSPFKFAVRLA